LPDGYPPDRTVAVFDFDGTVTRYDSLLLFLRLVLNRHRSRIKSCWSLPFEMAQYKIGVRDNTWLKHRYLGAIMRGLSVADLSPVVDQVCDRLLSNGIRPAARAEIERRKEVGHRTVLVSGSLDVYLETMAARLGLSDCLCTIAECDTHGRFTGRLSGANCIYAEKVHRLNVLLGEDRGSWQVDAYGDSVVDLPLLRAADNAYMINAKGRLARQSRSANATVIRW
jgi:HAD superfamily hydrolase (TIGR01490 family)